MQFPKIQQKIKEGIPKGLIIPEHTEYEHFYRHTGVNEKYKSVTTKAGILDKKYLKTWAVKLAVEYIGNNLPVDSDSFPLVAMEAKDQAGQVLKDASELGTAGHEVIEIYLDEWIATGEQPKDIRDFIPSMKSHPEYSEDIRLMAVIRSAEKFLTEKYIVPLCTELLVGSSKHQIAGTLDLAGMVPTITGGDETCRHTFWRSSSSKPEATCLDCKAHAKYHLALIDWKTTNSADKPDYAIQLSAYRQAFKELVGIMPKKLWVAQVSKTKVDYTIYEVTDPATSFKMYKHLAAVSDWLDVVGTGLKDIDAKKVIRI